MPPILRIAAALTALGTAVTGSAPAHAESALHHVRYTVFADGPIWAEIYYRDIEPGVFSDYSHNPYIFSPNVEADIGPDKPWVFDATMANPDLWAMVVVQSGESPQFPTPAFHCELAVDGVAVKKDSGPRGALCSIRNW
jgi:hypothetical protein